MVYRIRYREIKPKSGRIKTEFLEESHPDPRRTKRSWTGEEVAFRVQLLCQEG
jgi:hypothetical protein